MAVTRPIVPHGQDRPSTQSRGSEPSRLVYTAWLYSPMFPRQDRDTATGVYSRSVCSATGTTGSVVKMRRHEEAVAQIANETFHFTFGLGPIRLAQARHKSIMVCKIPQARVKAVLAFTIGVAGLDHRAHVVVKHLKRLYATKLVKGLFVTGSECLELFILHKGSKGVAAETQGGRERRQPHGS